MKNTIEQMQVLQKYKLKCKHYKISPTYDSDVVYPAMDEYATLSVEAALKKVEDILRTRIKELNEADAYFCSKRWDMSQPEFLRQEMRNQSNSVTLARQDLESVLQKLGLPRYPTPPNI